MQNGRLYNESGVTRLLDAFIRKQFPFLYTGQTRSNAAQVMLEIRTSLFAHLTAQDIHRMHNQKLYPSVLFKICRVEKSLRY